VTGKTSKSDARREEIIVAAAACFSEKGLKGAGVADICARLGISPGHLYYYFKSKDAIVLALLDRLRARTVEEIRDAAAEDDPLGHILGGDYLAEAAARQEGVIDVATMWEVYADAARSPVVAAKNHQHWRETSAALRRLVEAEQARGRIRADADLDLFMTLLSMIIVTTSLAVFADPDFDAARYRNAGATMLAPFLASATTSRPVRRPA
jgi:TetR/AcrR family transcriptional repressor of uid operon